MIGKFTKDTIFTFINQIFITVISLGVMIVIVRVLGPEGKGIFSLALLLPAFLVILTHFGIGGASIYYLGRNKYDPKEIFGNNILYTVFVSIFAIFIGLAVIFFFSPQLFPGVEKKYLFLALFLIPLQHFLNFINIILLGIQKIKKYNFVLFFQNFIFLILITILLLGLHFGIVMVITAQIASFILAGILLFFLVKREAKGISFKLNRLYLKDVFSYGSKAYFSNIFDFLNSYSVPFLINIFINPVAVGFYSVAMALVGKLLFFSQSAATVLYPRVSSEKNPKRLKDFTPIICRGVLSITTIGAILSFFLSYWLIVLLFSKTFLNAVQVFRILLIGVVPMSGSGILSNDIAGRGKPILNTYIYGRTFFLSTILYVILIPRWGIEGAAWAMTISYFFLFITMLITYAKISGNKIRDTIILQKSDFQFYKHYLKGLHIL